MKYEQAYKICQNFANKYKIVFEDCGEVGFGRKCVGFLHGGCYISHNPFNSTTYKPIPKFESEKVYPPNGVDAYHKHDCLAVMGHGEDSVIQLAKWVKHLESQGEVKIETFETGAEGIQALFSGVTGKTVMVY